MDDLEIALDLAGLGPRGRRLVEDLQRTISLTAAKGALVLEAARLVDTLDVLDRAITSAQELDKGLLGERRQHQLALRVILNDLAAGNRPQPQAGSKLDDLAARRAAREAGA